MVGPDGAGKSTLLKILNGSGELDAELVVALRATIGYLPQYGIVLRGKTLFGEVEFAFEDRLELKSRSEQTAKEIAALDC